MSTLIAGMQAPTSVALAAPLHTLPTQAPAQDTAQSQAQAPVSALSQAASNAGAPQVIGTPSATATPEASVADLQAQLAVANDRYTNLQSFSDRTRDGLQKQVAQLQTASPVFVPPTTPEELVAFKAENPGWYGAIESIAHGIAAKSNEALTADLRQTQAREAATQIQMAHPDCSTIFADPNFEAWAATQGPEVQGWLNEEHDGSKVIRAIQYFKDSQAVNTGNYSNQVQSQDISGLVNTRSPLGAPQVAQQVMYTGEQIGKMTQHEYEAQHKDIMAAYAAGLVSA